MMTSILKEKYKNVKKRKNLKKENLLPADLLTMSFTCAVKRLMQVLDSCRIRTWNFQVKDHSLPHCTMSSLLLDFLLLPSSGLFCTRSSCLYSVFVSQDNHYCCLHDGLKEVPSWWTELHPRNWKLWVMQKTLQKKKKHTYSHKYKFLFSVKLCNAQRNSKKPKSYFSDPTGLS